MNAAPDNPELIERLAAEYVLGTLRGAARVRLERWRTTSNLVNDRCRFWEERLMPLLRELTAVPPPPHVWQDIRRRLNFPAAATRRRSTTRALALAASVLLVVGLAALFYWRTLLPGAPLQVATVSASSGALMWKVELYGKSGETTRLGIRAGALAAPPAGHDYELWALPKEGSPVSLGVLPYRESTARRELTAVQRQALARSTQLAVSVEPPGGSPTGQPTGAVVFVVPLHAAG